MASSTLPEDWGVVRDIELPGDVQSFREKLYYFGDEGRTIVRLNGPGEATPWDDEFQ